MDHSPLFSFHNSNLVQLPTPMGQGSLFSPLLPLLSGFTPQVSTNQVSLSVGSSLFFSAPPAHLGNLSSITQHQSSTSVHPSASGLLGAFGTPSFTPIQQASSMALTPMIPLTPASAAVVSSIVPELHSGEDVASSSQSQVIGNMGRPRRIGQCTVCLRILSLTISGVLYKHGPGCTGSGLSPADGTSSEYQPHDSKESVQNKSSLSGSASSSALPHKSSVGILNLLQSLQSRAVKRIPKGSRIHAAAKLGSLLSEVCSVPDDVEKWVNLLSFGSVCFAVPDRRGGKRHQSSLPSRLNAAIATFPTQLNADRQLQPSSQVRRCHSTTKNRQTDNLAVRVSAKLEDGDICGAIRLAASDETIAPCTQAIADSLRLKHPPRVSHPKLTSSHQPSQDAVNLILSETAILAAVKSFPAGSSGGMDGLRPQHLKDLVGATTGDTGQRLLAQLTDFVNLCLSGRVPEGIRPVFCGASLCALNKKGGGIRPIAVGCTLRRLVAKAACKALTAKMAALFLPVQVGFGVPRAAEAAAHAARRYLASMQPGQGLLKIDFTNAFNMVSRDVMLQCVVLEMPELLSFVNLCYADSSHLLFGDHLLSSDEGVQQGDPLGPLLFCLTILRLAKSMSSEFNVWYMDDAALGGDVDSLVRDFQTIKMLGKDFGVAINEPKCEIVTNDPEVVARIREVAPNIIYVPVEETVFLGAPIGTEVAVSRVLAKKLDDLRRLQQRITKLSAHDAFFLLKNCFSLPKLLYTLRSSPCFLNLLLLEYDAIIRQTLQSVLNVSLSDESWQQASLPVSLGGLGIRSAGDIALPAFLSSTSASVNLVNLLLPERILIIADPNDICARNLWSSKVKLLCPVQLDSSRQKSWDRPLMKSKLESLMSSAQSQTARARLLAVASPHSGDFLNAVPCAHVGTKLDDSSFRIATALRVGVPVCAPHVCICGVNVDQFGTHGLACRQSAGRLARHSAVNDLIKRALASAEIPSRLEPTCLTRTDGKRPDGLSLVPWREGKCLVWDFTCADTLAPSHVERASSAPAAVANEAELRKRFKYTSLEAQYVFIPVAVETFGALGDEATSFLTDVGRRIATVTGESRSTQFLLQRLSVAIQRGNAICVLGTAPSDACLDELFYL